MTTIAILLLTIIMFGIFIKLHLNFQKSNDAHFAEMQSLESMLTNLQKVQRQLYQKVQILESYNKDYKKAEAKIFDEIVALQHQLFKNI